MKYKYKPSDHTFAICAYKESPYLEECIRSVLDQSVRTNVLIATSTGNDYIRGLAAKYNIPLFINEKDAGHSSIGKDWNFCYKCADTALVTITHQDDIYYPEYAEKVIENLNRPEAVQPIIAFTDYAERRNGFDVTENKLLNIKQKLLSPLRNPSHWRSRWIRRRILSLGSPICCPAVTYVRDNVSDPLFLTDFAVSIDWQTWERLSRLDGSFVYCHEVLMAHRIHEGSETTNQISDGRRSREDFEMYCKFWPKPVARLIEHFYSDSEKQNTLTQQK